MCAASDGEYSNTLPLINELISRSKKQKGLFSGLISSLQVFHSTSFHDIAAEMFDKLTEKEVQCWLVIKNMASLPLIHSVTCLKNYKVQCFIPSLLSLVITVHGVVHGCLLIGLQVCTISWWL